MTRDTIGIATAAAAAKKRGQTHCKHGHPMRTTKGRRRCRRCALDCQRHSQSLAFVAMRQDKDDPRHGTTYGYGCGCRCNRCGWAKSEQRYRLRERKP